MPLNMNTENESKYHDILNILGEKKVDELYQLLGSEKISIASVKKFSLKRKIFTSLIGFKKVSDIAKENCISRMTIYREIKKSIKSEQNVTNGLVTLST